MKIRDFSAILLGFLVVGCVRTHVSMLDQRTMFISGHGGLGTDMGMVAQRVLVDAATGARAAGFRYFAIVGQANTSTAGAIILPGQSNTTGTVSGYGSMATYTSTTTYTPGQAIPYVNPGQDLTVRFMKEGEFVPGAQGVWDADSILAAQPKK